ncbi:MAG: hypothetical protein IBX56_03430 [Methylomicrobium sp.]|nr:hypothetical protein [Methylomicrobium sp.]
MNTERIDRILGSIAKLEQAPAPFKKSLADLIGKTGQPVEDITIGDFLKLAAAQCAVHRKQDTETVDEHCLFHGNGTIAEKTALIARILSERAKNLNSRREDLDAATALAKTWLENGHSGSTALMHGYSVLLRTAHPLQAA